MLLPPGTVFAGYTVERELGAGGMGVVYLARHPRLPRRVALKLLHRELTSVQGYPDRFRREAETVARLNHPNIVPVEDCGEDDGLLWLSMPFIDGMTADTALRSYEGGMPVERAVWIVGRVASALDFAHRNQLVHRDVKPANILLTTGADDEPERVFLSDFGVAKGLDESPATSLTMAGDVVATLDYAAPEQIEGKPLDAACDIYALGCVLYKLLTGSIPYPGESVAAKVYAHLHHPPPKVTDRRPDLPVALDLVIARALARDPQDRYQTCRELAQEALHAGGSRSGTTTTAALTVGPHDRTEALTPMPGPWGTTPDPWRTTADQYPQGRPGQTPAGHRPSGSAAPPHGQPGPGRSAPLPPTPPRKSTPVTPAPASASGEEVSARSGGARKWVIGGSAVALIAAAAVVGLSLRGSDDGPGSGTALLPGTSSAGPSDTEVPPSTEPPSTEPSGTEPSGTAESTGAGTVTSGPSSTPGPSDPVPGLPSSSPVSADTIVVSRAGADGSALYPMDSVTGEVGEALFAPRAGAQNPQLSTDRGSVIYIQSLGEVNELRTSAVDGSDDRVLAELPDGCTTVNRPAWNPVRRTELALPCGNDDGGTTVIITAVTGETIATLELPGIVVADDLSFSPDGRELVFWGTSDTGATGELYVATVEPDLSLPPTAPQPVPVRQITEVGRDGAATDPVWSPDGTLIAYARIVQGRPQIAVIGPEGGDITVLTDSADAGSQGPTWSPEGDRLAFKRNARADTGVAPAEVWVMNADGSNPRVLGNGDPGSVNATPSWGAR